MRIGLIVGGSRDGETVKTEEDMHHIQLIERTQDVLIRDMGALCPDMDLKIEHYRLEKLVCETSTYYMWVWEPLTINQAISFIMSYYQTKGKK